MTSTKILATSLCALLVAACSNDQTATSSASGPARVPTAGAASVHGDLMPTSLLKIGVPAPSETALLRGSDALAPNKDFGLETPALAVVGRDYHRILTGSDAAALTFPVDTPVGARVLVRTSDRSPIPSVHMHSVATGLRLDHARDSLNTAHVGHVGQSREPAFDSLLDARTLSFDEPFTRGLVQIDLPRETLAHGVYVEVQEPSSRITLSAVTGERTYTHGETAEVAFSLADGGGAIDGAHVEAYADLPGHTRSPAFTVTALGNGQYSARVPLSGPANMGVWGIHVTASGSSNGVAFERNVDTAFEYAPAHARMTAFGLPTITRGSDGLVDEVSVDVDVETLSDDRFSLRGTLTYTGADNAEHPLAAAQTGQTLSAGKGTITLHFTADAMALAGVDGPFHLRDVALVSQGFGVTQHRIGRGLDLVTHAIAASEIRYPAQIPLQAQDLMANGDLPTRRK